MRKDFAGAGMIGRTGSRMREDFAGAGGISRRMRVLPPRADT